MEATLTTWPAPCATKRGSTAAMPFSTPPMLTSIIRVHSSVFSAAMGDSGMMPALLISTSTRPNRVSAASAKVAKPAASVTSSACQATLSPSSSASACSRSVRRAPMNRRAPVAASSRTVASPMPLDAPVISTVLLMEMVMVVPFLSPLRRLHQMGPTGGPT